MPVTKRSIAPRRSIALFALLAVAMAIFSYGLILLLALACVYLPYLVLMSTESANTQMSLLQICGIAVAGAILWALLPRRDKFEAPGLLLERTAHPRLFTELEAIAAALDEQLPQEVYLVGQVNAFVSDRGGILGFGSRRVMGIGLPLLSSLTVPEIRAVLAHEFGHYYGGDTRMGPWVYKTQSAMIRAFQNIGSLQRFGRIAALQFVNLVVASILQWYFIFFLRVSNLLSRRKEYRADELACLVAGCRPLAEGLRKIHGAAIAWGPYWNSEVVPILNQGCLPAIGDGFSRFLAAPQIAAQVTAGIAKEIAERKTAPFDTHPPLRDRIAAIEKLGLGSGEESQEVALALLDQADSVEQKFLELLNPKLAKDSLRHVGWDEVGRAITIPSWQQAVAEYSALLAGITAGSIPLATANLQQMGAKIRDPQGMLLTPQARAQRAGHLLNMALALAMTENGWELQAQPGSFYLRRGELRFDAVSAVEEMLSGKTPPEEWAKLCADLGIADLPLVRAPQSK
ncbi:MAG TPA: M48 family metallopeptidase [Candidatus Acidoferrum sp.]|nr:M48 family metallopeptidase [Candidatus Acidoferrum sp.]